MVKLHGVSSNWEFVSWYLIDPFVSEKDQSFSRTQILRKNYEEIYTLLIICGHKNRPEHPEATIQKTLQNMRDKNWIIFHGQGDYSLTTEGYNELLTQRDNIKKIRSLSHEDLKLLRKMVSAV